MVYSITRLRDEFNTPLGDASAMGALLDLATAVLDVQETVCSSPGACEGAFHVPTCAACKAWDRFQTAARRVAR